MSEDEPLQKKVGELDEAWAAALAEAEAQARAAGRADITEYLALRSSNDFLRKTATDWLLSTFANVADEMNRAGASLQVSTEDHYQFKIGNAAMVGKLLKLENGIRQLLIEVGWPRIPQHGFIRGGGLALSNIRHVGIKSASEELRLLTSTEGSPRWVIDRGPQNREFDESQVRKHVDILIDYTHVEN
jgi:hypothetical protein